MDSLFKEIEQSPFSAAVICSVAKVDHPAFSRARRGERPLSAQAIRQLQLTVYTLAIIYRSFEDQGVPLDVTETGKLRDLVRRAWDGQFPGYFRIASEEIVTLQGMTAAGELAEAQ